MSSGLELMQRCFDTNVRIEKILHLPVMTIDMDTEMYHFLVDECADILCQLLEVEDISAVTDQYGDQRDAQREALSEAIAWKLPKTWLVQGATPVKERATSSGYMFSWGYYHTKWFSAETYDDALEQAIAWAEEDEARVRAEGKKEDG